jgi:O-acetyl-ADP-ribose deacetylase (regulator of RNase III)
MTPEVIEGDLLDQDAEVIVNAWNRNIIPWWLLWPHGVSGAIKRHAGLQPFFEVGKLGPIPLGQAVITSAGKLPFRAIIHVAGINGFWRASEYSIRHSVRNAMRLAEKHGFKSVDFPVIGSGAGSFSRAKALEFMLDEMKQLDSRTHVRIVQFVPQRHASGKTNKSVTPQS